MNSIMSNLYFPLCAVMIYIVILGVFFGKQRVNSDETKAYSKLIIIGFLESTLACILVILQNKFGKPSYIYNIHRIDYILILFWMWSLFDYIVVVALNSRKKIRNIIRKSTFILNIIISAAFFLLKVNVIVENGIIDTNGDAMNLLMLFIVFYILFMSVLVVSTIVKNVKSSNNKKFVPLIVLVGLGVGAIILRGFAPEILFISLVGAFADLIMLFTVENPDVKVIYELNRNKKLLESMSEEKSNFLFSMSQETRKPIENILEVKKILENEKDLKEIDKGLKVIENNTRSLNNIINNVLDISNMTSSKLSVYNETYNPKSLISMCVKSIEQKLGDKVELRFNMSKNLPDELYGDPVKLKQVISSVLLNACKYTKEGFIEVSVNEIVKYDMCRLIINIEDSGCGISVEKLNELLKTNKNIEDTDLIKMDGLDIDLKLAFKIIRKLNGFINIKSEEKVGSTFIIAVDQKIKVDEDNYYKKYIFNKKKVMVLTDNKKLLKDINSLVKNYDIELLSSIFSSDLVQRVKDSEVFDLIILDDKTQSDTALATLQELQKLKCSAPCVVMLPKEEEKLTKHLLEDGFSNYIIKENLEKDFDKIIKKYI